MMLATVGLFLQIGAGLHGFNAVQGLTQEVPKGVPGKVTITVDISKDTVVVAEPFKVTVKMRAPRGSRFDIPATIDTVNLAGMDTAGAFERFDSDTAPDYSDVTAVYTLAAWDWGRQRLGLDSVTVHFPNGTDTVMTLDPIALVRAKLPNGADTVIAYPILGVFVKPTIPIPKSLADVAKLRPKPPHDVIPEPAEVARRKAEQKKTYTGLIVGLVAALLLGLLAYRWYRKRNVPQPVPDPVESEFQKVEAMHLIEQGKPELHAMLMADVLRRYLVRHYPTIRESATTFELHRVLPKVSLVPGDRTLSLLEQIDLLKFAHAKANVDEASKMGTESRAIVREVMAREEAARLEAERQAALAAEQQGKTKGKKAA